MFRSKRFLPKRFGSIVTASGPVQVAFDDFDRGDDITLGAKWTLMNSTVPNILRVVSLQCKSPSTGTGPAFWNFDAVNSNQYSKLQIINNISSAFTTSWGVIARASGTAATDDFAGYAVTVDGTNYVIGRWSGGALAATLASGAQAVANNDYIEIRCSGTNIAFYLNGALINSANDANIASGRAGLIVINAGIIDPICDNWSCGNL